MKQTHKLTADDVKKIPVLRRRGMTNKEIAEELGVHETAIQYWIPRLRKAGHKIIRVKRGGKPLDLSI